MTAAQQVAAIDKLLAQKHGDVQKPSPLTGCGCYFVVLGHLYGVDGRLAVAIAGAETTYATDPGMGADLGRKNPFGYGPHIEFSSWEHGIKIVTRRLGQLGVGDIRELGRIWVNGPGSKSYPEQWLTTVTAVLRELGADPAKLRRPPL